MNIVEFYTKLSKLMEQCREKNISTTDAKLRLKKLLAEAELAKLDVQVSEKILDLDSLVNYDDERSYEEEASYEESYNEDDEESQSSY